ncbi:MAG: MoaD/ThiS family protein [Fimbriimonas sp.]|nr:MoaD/ThiS family protein [Fimbriimonas sp.]
MIRVTLPFHLRNLAHVGNEVELRVDEPVCVRSTLDALEAQYPVLKGTIREHVSHKRRAFLRFFAAGEDISTESPDLPLPESIVAGREPFMVVGAIAGG